MNSIFIPYSFSFPSQTVASSFVFCFTSLFFPSFPASLRTASSQSSNHTLFHEIFVYYIIPAAGTRKFYFLFQFKIKGKLNHCQETSLHCTISWHYRQSWYRTQKQDTKPDGAGRGSDAWKTAETWSREVKNWQFMTNVWIFDYSLNILIPPSYSVSKYCRLTWRFLV